MWQTTSKGIRIQDLVKYFFLKKHTKFNPNNSSWVRNGHRTGLQRRENQRATLEGICYHACLQAQRNNRRDGILDNKHKA